MSASFGMLPHILMSTVSTNTVNCSRTWDMGMLDLMHWLRTNLIERQISIFNVYTFYMSKSANTKKYEELWKVQCFYVLIYVLILKATQDRNLHGLICMYFQDGYCRSIRCRTATGLQVMMRAVMKVIVYS